MTDEASDSVGEDLAVALHDAHAPALLRWARRRFADEQAAEEVVQETLLNAWRKYHQFDPDRGTERSWVFGIGRNVAATRFARGRRHLRSVPTEALPEVAANTDETNRLAERSLIVDAMHSLTTEHREVVAVTYWDGLSTRQAAERLSIPEGTVKSRLYYALRSLRGALETSERKAFEAHLSRCDICSAEVRSVAVLPGLLIGIDRAELEPGPGPWGRTACGWLRNTSWFGSAGPGACGNSSGLLRAAR